MLAMSNNVKINNKGNKYSLFIAFVIFIVLQFFFISQAIAKDSFFTLQSKDQKTIIKQQNVVVLVGVVDVTYLMEHAPQAEVASSNLKSKFLPQEKSLAASLEDIQKLEKTLERNARNLKTSQKRFKERELRSKKRSRSRSLQDFREELRFARDSALDDVQKEVFQAIDDVRKQKGIDIVLQDYVSASKRVDITTSVLEHLVAKLKVETEQKLKEQDQ